MTKKARLPSTNLTVLAVTWQSFGRHSMKPIVDVKRPPEEVDGQSAMQPQALISYLEHDGQPTIVLDPEYNILAANAAYRRQFAAGGTPVGRKCYQVSHHYEAPCDQSGEHCPMRQARETHAPDRVLHIHHTPRGPEHVDVELRPILDEIGVIVGYVERLATVKAASAKATKEGLVGRSPAFTEALSSLQRVAPSGLPVLLLGESGTGKELFARAVHEASARARGPFVVVDCSGLTETLFESELFGYEKGAFTGAAARKLGLVETATGGTLFLDEVGDIPLPLQVKLLRLIESSTFRRVGSVETQRADFRLIAATHKSLESMVAEGAFRQDLYYRISAFPIHLPALRQRMDDIPLLVESLLERSFGATAQSTYTIDDEAMNSLRHHKWPGNIRELRNVLERAKLYADDQVIHRQHLALKTMGIASVVQESASPFVGVTLSSTRLDDKELRAQMQQHRGSRRELALKLGLSERTLYRRLNALTVTGDK